MEGATQRPSIDDAPRVKCVACSDSEDGLIAAQRSVGNGLHESLASNYFKSAQWSPDGTTIITNSADNHLRSFILPPDLLEGRDRPHVLQPYHAIPSKEPIYSVAIYPFYELQDPSTTCLLSGVRDHPIRLNSALYPSLLGSYSLISPTTEAFITPHSLIYPSTLGGTHFLAGSDSMICLFDISRPGKEGPVSRLPTIPSKRRKLVGGGVGMKGIISAMSIDAGGSRILAAGTFTRQVGLYGDNGAGDTIATFSIADTVADKVIGGNGVTQVLWSPCGRYLYVLERKSDGALVYDIRVTGRLVGWLKGRGAATNQRLDAGLIRINESSELWAGGIDGVVRMWKHPCHAGLAGLRPTWEEKLHHGKFDPITSAAVHPAGGILATCSGQKQYASFSDDNANEVVSVGRTGCQIDNSLKIWELT
ncbi:WD repeat-containing protein 79 [Nannizzia gypsea CBS 118893]|uniref:WD repeat-containing protein 79 n=1 Tax=Arthroderma gypseum (strain ATCC MYA-4604 / CBS 118893) TaxID=535722 RepID=E5R1X4_ARTGP|nr:WD repeat-containing protein 79 [Nannizzia gypsea CBS 118893]EFQ96967.1 WD repeat-containing protein 79 [Nannizzia gypsea CBS 118893]